MARLLVSREGADGTVYVSVRRNWRTTALSLAALAGFYMMAETLSVFTGGLALGAIALYYVLGGKQETYAYSPRTRRSTRTKRFLGLPYHRIERGPAPIAFVAVGAFGHAAFRRPFQWRYGPVVVLANGEALPFSVGEEDRYDVEEATREIARIVRAPYRELPEDREFIEPGFPVDHNATFPTRDAAETEALRERELRQRLMRIMIIGAAVGFLAAMVLPRILSP